MQTLTYTQFLKDLHMLPKGQTTSKGYLGFSPYLAFLLIQTQLLWSLSLSRWDARLRAKSRPVTYLSLLIILVFTLVLPLCLAPPSGMYSPVSSVSEIPVVPIEPTWIPDTLIINQSLNQLSHEH